MSKAGDELLLVEQIANGNQKAFEQLFREYHPRIYRFSIRLLGVHHLAEEATCDTLFAVWEGASKFLGSSTVSTWIFGIAYRRSMKSHNKDARHSKNIEPEVELDELTQGAPETNPETYTSNFFESSRMSEALNTLGPEHKAVIELMAVGHSVAEIAAIVQCPENTVKTRTFHARKKLRTFMKANYL